MTHHGSHSSRHVRDAIGHPIIDCDGHQLEFEPIMQDYVREIAGQSALDRVRRNHDAFLAAWPEMTAEQRRDVGELRGPWGLQTTNVAELATVMVPRLLHSRLDELGIDFAIQYPTLAIGYSRMAQRDERAVVCRALNRYNADLFRDLGDRLTPAAVIPTDTPEEAIAEVEYAVGELGLKVIVIPTAVRRPIPAFARQYPDAPPALARHMTWLDFYGIDSAHDYDPLWRRCSELGVAVTAHMAGFFGSRTSISSYSFNHIGLFASSNEAFCKSLVFAGVTGRFPRLRFGLLEGGVGWAPSLLGDIVEHWEKRRGAATRDYDPAKLDTRRLEGLLRQHGGERFARHIGGAPLSEAMADLYLLAGWRHYDAGEDDWHRSGIETVADIRDRFVPSFFFGCEAEDPAVGWALGERCNQFGAPLNAMFGSDIGHWDVAEPAGVVAEAYEAVEHGLMTPEQFRAFTFDNPVKLHATGNPEFFRGTTVEREAAAVLARC